MKNKGIFFLFTLISLASLNGQTIFHHSDISHFFEAFDSLQTTTDPQKQVDFVQKIYIDQGSLGLKYAIDNSIDGGKKATAKDWANYMLNNKEKIIQSKPYFDNLQEQMKILVPKFQYFKDLYPEFKDGNVYFFIGLGMFGGRPEETNLYIGCEVVANEKPDWAVSIVLHEYVHTLQKMSENALLAHCLNEGAADFIAELVNQKSLRVTYPNGYIDFGYKNEKAIWKSFKQYIASNEKGKFFNWLYGMKGRNINGSQMRDLGYFMGYKICKAYYDNAIDKKKAIREIIEMDVSTDEKARLFLQKSGYAAKSDAKFIRNFQFKKVIEANSQLKLIQYGYQFDKDQVIFQFVLPQSIDKKAVEYITIAGSFNGWNPKDLNFKMTNKSENIYEFSLPKSKFSNNYNEFKFVINGDNWQAPPENAKNVQNGNLTLEIK